MRQHRLELHSLCAGNGSAEVAYRAQQLLEHSLLSELRAIVARALSGLDMFAGNQLSELDLLGSDFMETLPQENVRGHLSSGYVSAGLHLPILSPWRGGLFARMLCHSIPLPFYVLLFHFCA